MSGEKEPEIRTELKNKNYKYIEIRDSEYPEKKPPTKKNIESSDSNDLGGPTKKPNWLKRKLKRGSIHLGLLVLLNLVVILLLVGMYNQKNLIDPRILYKYIFVITLTDPIVIIKSAFVIIASFLPVAMYYAFMSRNIYSALDEFVIKLERLGLLKEKYESLSILSPIRRYLERFEDVYGEIPPDLSKFYYSIGTGSDEGHKASNKDWVNIYEEISFSDIILVSLATIFITIGWLLILFPVQTSQESSVILQGNSISLMFMGTPAVSFAFLGAYLFSIEVLCRRYASKDLRAIAFAIVSKRILVAVILISVISLIMLEETTTAPTYNISNQSFNISITVPLKTNTSSNFLCVLGFVIGFFPEVAWEYIKKRVTPVVIPSLKKELPLSDLDGITLWDESRLHEEDIEDIPQMATADIVDLFLDTKIPSDRIIDWVDQAILYKCLATEDASNSLKTKLQVKGIRTSSSFIMNYKDLKDLDFDEKSMKSIVKSLTTYSNLELVMNWKNMGDVYKDIFN